MTKRSTKKLVRFGLLCISTLLISFNIGSVLGDTAEERYYYTPTAQTQTENVIEEYKYDGIYLIDLIILDFNPNKVQILKDERLVQEEELASEEKLNMHSIDLNTFKEGIYKIIISDRLGHIVTETILHKTT